MIKHIVMFRFLPEADGRSGKENAGMTKKMLDRLVGKVPTLRTSETHLNDEKADNTNYDLLLISTFDTWEDMNAYIVHPDHKAVGEFMKPLRESRSCVDYEE